jgi:hypothetical protein
VLLCSALKPWPYCQYQPCSKRVRHQVALLKLLCVLLNSANAPLAVFCVPLLLLKGADCPSGSIPAGVTAVRQRNYGGQISQGRKAKKH